MFSCVCVCSGVGGGWQDTIPRFSCSRGTSCPGGVGVGQDKLLHQLKLDTEEETNHLRELSRNKCTSTDETA